MDTYEISRLLEAAYAAVRQYYEELADPTVMSVAREVCRAEGHSPDEMVCLAPLIAWDTLGRYLAPSWAVLAPRWYTKAQAAEAALKAAKTVAGDEPVGFVP